MKQSLEDKIKEIAYAGILCDPNGCDTQYIDAAPCNCGGEYRRLTMIKAIEALLEEVQREALNTDKVTRVEVIDHTKDFEEGGGRAYVNWKDTNKVELSFQDEGRTLKVFISNQKDKQE